MDKLLTVSDIAARYKVCEATARNYMRQMIHMEKPLMVTERALATWESERTVDPIDKRISRPRRTGTRLGKSGLIPYRTM